MIEVLGTIFNELLTRPLFNILVLFYQIIPGHDLGLAIIIMTVLIRLALYPLSQKSIRSQKYLSQLQPKIKELQNKYKNNKEEQVKQVMALYRKHKVNPASGCLPLLIQLPILIALYRVFYSLTPDGLSEKLNSLYSFVSRPKVLDPNFLGLLNLSQASIGLAVLAGLLMFVQSKMTLGKKQLTQSKLKIAGVDLGGLMGRQMTYFMPFFVVLIAMRLPAALSLYWVVITLFGIIQQYLIEKKEDKKLIAT